MTSALTCNPLSGTVPSLAPPCPLLRPFHSYTRRAVSAVCGVHGVCVCVGAGAPLAGGYVRHVLPRRLWSSGRCCGGAVVRSATVQTHYGGCPHPRYRSLAVAKARRSFRCGTAQCASAAVCCASPCAGTRPSRSENEVALVPPALLLFPLLVVSRTRCARRNGGRIRWMTWWRGCSK